VIALLITVALLAALAWAASRWGADTRESGEWTRPHRPMLPTGGTPRT
jgi:hypothetical protein